MRMTRTRETMAAVKEKSSVKDRATKAARCAYALGMATSTFATAATMSAVTAFAETADEKANQVMDNVVNYMIKICRYVGIGLLAFGAYELAMAFIQQAPEQKTKGILIMVVGAIMTAMGTFISTITGHGNADA